MEIRTLEKASRGRLLARLAGIGLPDGWNASEWLRRSIENDPSYDDSLVWLAYERSDEGEVPVAGVQVVPRTLRILGHPVPTGGISTAFAQPNYEGGAATRAVLGRAVEDMRARGLELSLVFASYRSFYGELGWHSWKGQHTLVQPSEHPPPVRPGAAPGGSIETRSFAPADLAAVRELHTVYAQDRHGIVSRDEALWRATFDLGGNPGEEFRVALRGGQIVAYLRAAHLYDVLTVTEMGRLAEGADGLAVMIRELLTPRHPDHLAPQGAAAFRASALLPTFDDLSLTVAMESLGLESHPLVDESAMLRCIDLPAFARRIGADVFAGETAHDFLVRILPEDLFVFWPTDRF